MCGKFFPAVIKDHQAITGGDGIPLLALVLGFFSYKAALVLQIWDDLKVLVVPKFDVDAFLKKYE